MSLERIERQLLFMDEVKAKFGTDVQTVLAERLNVAQSRVGDLLKGKKPGHTTARKVADAMGMKRSEVFLIFDLKLEPVDELEDARKDRSEKAGTFTRNISIPSRGTACCGVGDFAFEGEGRDLAEVTKAEALFTVSGESMEPFYFDGDMLLVRDIHSLDELKPGRKYIIRLEDNIPICRIYKETKDGEIYFEAANHNGKYPEICVDEKEVRVDAIVLYKLNEE